VETSAYKVRNGELKAEEALFFCLTASSFQEKSVGETNYRSSLYTTEISSQIKENLTKGMAESDLIYLLSLHIKIIKSLRLKKGKGKEEVMVIKNQIKIITNVKRFMINLAIEK